MYLCVFELICIKNHITLATVDTIADRDYVVDRVAGVEILQHITFNTMFWHWPQFHVTRRRCVVIAAASGVYWSHAERLCPDGLLSMKVFGVRFYGCCVLDLVALFGSPRRRVILYVLDGFVLIASS